MRICDCPGAALQIWKDQTNKLLVACGGITAAELERLGNCFIACDEPIQQVDGEAIQVRSIARDSFR